MRVQLDDEIRILDVRTVGEAIDVVRRETERDGRVVTDVVVDGAAWTEELASADHLAASALEVRFTSIDRRELVVGVLADVVGVLDEIDARQRDAADALQSDRADDGREALTQVLVLWLQVRDAVEQVVSIEGIDLEGLLAEAAGLPHPVSNLRDRLLAIETAVRADDPIGLSDVLGYELPQIVADWKEMIDRIRQRVGAGGPDA